MLAQQLFGLVEVCSIMLSGTLQRGKQGLMYATRWCKACEYYVTDGTTGNSCVEVDILSESEV